MDRDGTRVTSNLRRLSMKRSLLFALCVTAGALPWSQAAQAGSGTMAATYYSVPNNGPQNPDPDFQRDPFTTPNITLGSSLGPNGLPVATNPFGVSDINPGTNEITWWSPTLNPNVSQTGTGFISVPYPTQTMFPPNSTGGNDASAFETATFKGDLFVPTAEAVSFHLTSDDDSLIYIDGKYIGGLPRVHAPTSTDVISGILGAGDHTLEVFYADRHTVDAEFGFSINTDNVSVSPGPTPGAGVLGLAFLVLAGAMTRMRGLLAR